MAQQLIHLADRQMLLAPAEARTMAPAFDENLLFILERRILDLFPMDKVDLAEESEEVTSFDFRQQARFFRVDCITYEDKVDEGLHLANMNSILASLAWQKVSVVMVIRGTADKSELYYGLVSHNKDECGGKLERLTESFRKAFASQFGSVETVPIGYKEIRSSIMEPIEGEPGEKQYVNAITGIPSVRKNDNGEPYVQGLDRFMEAMRGEEYTLVSIANAMSLREIDDITSRCRELGGEIHSQVKATVTKQESTTKSINVGMMGFKNNSGKAWNAIIYSFKAVSEAVGINVGFGYSRTSGRMVSQETYNKSAEYCEQLCARYEERLRGGKNLGFWTSGLYLLTHREEIQARGSGLLRSLLSGQETHWEPIRSTPLSNKSVKFLRAFQNPRFNLLEYGVNKKEDIKEEVVVSKAIHYLADLAGKKVDEFLNKFREYKPEQQDSELEKARQNIGSVSDAEISEAWNELKTTQEGHPFGKSMSGLGTPVNSEELSIIMNPPRMDTQGITVRQAASFGANYPVALSGDNVVKVGSIMIKREVDKRLEFTVPARDLCKHGFICGVTGSGKTNTCMHLLRQLGSTPFMVIEPAKNEYRHLLSSMHDVRVFTLGNEQLSPFRLNPFEFSPGTELLTHVDRLKSVFNAAFPMYASMPYLLEEAILDVYLDKGWELSTSSNRYIGKSGLTEDWQEYLPTLGDLLEKIDTVVRRKQYAQELTMDLSAALKARISSLLVGSKGMMFNTTRSTPMDELLKSHVVLELRHLGDDDEKCFAMGLILSSIYEHLEAKGDSKADLDHLILIEEAHRLLKHSPQVASMEVSNPQGKAVETFSNMISEIRAWGTGVMIVDQIPAKLTPDVIKNTNLKLVHRTLARDDRELVGATMSLSPAQSEELPRLKVGQVVAHREGWDKAFLVKVPYVKAEGEEQIGNEHLKSLMEPWHKNHDRLYVRIPGLESSDKLRQLYQVQDFRGFNTDAYRYVLSFVLGSLTLGNDKVREIKELIGKAFMRSLKANEPMLADAWFLHYLQVFCKELDSAHPGSLDKVLLVRRLITELWMTPDSKKTQTLQRELSQALLLATAADDSRVPVLRWFAKADRADAALNESIPENMDEQTTLVHVDRYLSTSVMGMLMGMVLAEPSMHELKVCYLKQILKGIPGKESIVKRFKERRAENGHSILGRHS